MNINRTMLGLAFLLLLGMLLTACTPTVGTDAADTDTSAQVAQPVSMERTIYVGPLLIDCQGEGPQKCMLVKEKPEDEYTLFYDQIDGFEYEEGYEYKLIVKEEQIQEGIDVIDKCLDITDQYYDG